MSNPVTSDLIKKKWAAILEHESLPKIKDEYKKIVTARLLENTDDVLRTEESPLLSEAAPTNSMGASSSTHGDGAIDIYDPVMISMTRRVAPNLMAFDICGVQPMTGPTGLIFALRARYGSQTGPEAFYDEANTGQSARGGANMASNGASGAGYANNTVPGGAASNLGGVPGVSNNAGNSTYNYAGAIVTARAEGLGSNTTAIFPEMAFSIERLPVYARERALKAEYSIELAQDLKNVHGMDAEGLLSEILSTEILAEINREVVRTINIVAKPGAQSDVATPGIFDLDTDSSGRWSVEKFKGLYFQLEREANRIAIETRRGRGNIIIASADVASALEMAGKLDAPSSSLGGTSTPDVTGTTFLGTLSGKYKLYLDPYATGEYMTIGYKGLNFADNGVFYCPYVPLQKLRAVNPDTMQPKIGYNTRYGMVANPFAGGPTAALGALEQDSNVYYRRILVSHIM